jgi:molybdopterin molybdotransferase
MQAKLKGDFKKRPGRTEFLRGALFRDEHQDLWVKPNGHQGSGILRSMSEADCLIVLSANVAQINHGESVDISVLNGLI